MHRQANVCLLIKHPPYSLSPSLICITYATSLSLCEKMYAFYTGDSVALLFYHFKSLNVEMKLRSYLTGGLPDVVIFPLHP